jgi:hypothetical protein
MRENVPKFIADLRQISADVKSVFGTLSSARLNWKPSATSWSIGQCFEHLIITNDLYFPNIQKVAAGTHRNNFFSKIPFSTDITAALMKNTLKPEQSRKMKTFKMFEPATSSISPTIIEEFAANQQKLIALIESVKDLDIDKIKISEPLSAALNLRLSDAFEILILHEKRHFLQAERVLQSENFPK